MIRKSFVSMVKDSICIILVRSYSNGENKQVKGDRFSARTNYPKKNHVFVQMTKGNRLKHLVLYDICT